MFEKPCEHLLQYTLITCLGELTTYSLSKHVKLGCFAIEPKKPVLLPDWTFAWVWFRNLRPNLFLRRKASDFLPASSSATKKRKTNWSKVRGNHILKVILLNKKSFYYWILFPFWRKQNVNVDVLNMPLSNNGLGNRKHLLKIWHLSLSCCKRPKFILFEL